MSRTWPTACPACGGSGWLPVVVTDRVGIETTGGYQIVGYAPCPTCNILGQRVPRHVSNPPEKP